MFSCRFAIRSYPQNISVDFFLRRGYIAGNATEPKGGIRLSLQDRGDFGNQN